MRFRNGGLIGLGKMLRGIYVFNIRDGLPKQYPHYPILNNRLYS